MAIVFKGTDAKVARMPGVKKDIRERRNAIAVEARALLAAHRQTGNHRIVTETHGPDGLVILEGRSPVSVEFGRGAYIRPDGTHVGGMEGLNILGRAARL